MGVPSQQWQQIDATLGALADQIVSFTNRVENLQNVGAETIPVNVSTNPVVSIGNLDSAFITNPPA